MMRYVRQVTEEKIGRASEEAIEEVDNEIRLSMGQASTSKQKLLNLADGLEQLGLKQTSQQLEEELEKLALPDEPDRKQGLD